MANTAQPGQGVLSFSPQPAQTISQGVEEHDLSIEYGDEEVDEEQYEDEAEEEEEEQSYGDENAMMMEGEDLEEQEDEAEEYDDEAVAEEDVQGTPIVVSPPSCTRRPAMLMSSNDL